MKLRRLLALVTSITLIHPSVVTGESACAWHAADGRGASAESGHGVAGHAMAAHHRATPSAEGRQSPAPGVGSVATPDAAPCETPAPHCCGALEGCSGSAAVTSGRPALAAGVPAAARLHEALHAAPASFASAPEPPPPKS